ncbi:hypothetical protein [Microbispora sp. ATCC PTA-5024]|uniref:hypothetical protein n=1 Tax=Microbispora sp. ATCC PTA-5024 TaxID=316330 RepID=UPI0003DD89E0|nr:hypothetical protein [Microbispora sp. ATCC PTA-5024]ETK32585.1 hypothetical protein MPTA5024_29085 [Microbispora sp. ATCC PTA-5024]
MLKRIPAAIAALALGGAVFAALPATAAGAAAPPPAPADLTVSPAPVVVKTDAGTSATFTFKTADTGSARLVDRNNKSVPLTVSGTGTYTATYTFTFADEPGVWKLEAKATKGAESATTVKEFQVHWITGLDVDATPDVVDQGGRITLRGALTYKEGSAWKQYDGQKVYLAFKPLGGDSYTRVDSVTTDAHGRFSAGEKAVRSGWWRAEFDGASDTESTISDSDRVDVRAAARPTRITGFDAYPEPVDRGDTLRLRGRLEIGGSSWDGFKGQKVRVLFKADGSSGWRYVASDWTDAYGRFFADVTARESGWWRAEYDGARGVKGATSGADHVTVRAPEPEPVADTRIVRFDAGPEPVRHGRYLRLKGSLQVWGDGWEGYGHHKVTLWFKKPGGHWSYVKTTWTNGSGKFWTKTKAVRSGTWKAVFGGDDEAGRSSSRTDYVKVKR